MIRNLLLCDVSLVGVIGVAAPANADQYDFVSFLDNNGVYYDSISDVIDLGKAVCTSTRRTGATDMAINGLVAAGYYSDVARGAIGQQHVPGHLARDQRPRGADCSRAGSSAAHARRASRRLLRVTPSQSARHQERGWREEGRIRA